MSPQSCSTIKDKLHLHSKQKVFMIHVIMLHWAVCNPRWDCAARPAGPPKRHRFVRLFPLVLVHSIYIVVEAVPEGPSVYVPRVLFRQQERFAKVRLCKRDWQESTVCFQNPARNTSHSRRRTVTHAPCKQNLPMSLVQHLEDTLFHFCLWIEGVIIVHKQYIHGSFLNNNVKGWVRVWEIQHVSNLQYMPPLAPSNLCSNNMFKARRLAQANVK